MDRTGSIQLEAACLSKPWRWNLFHSGSLAIRAAVASKVNITYKILFNEAVAMTGGQAIDGSLSLDALLHQIRAEGVEHIAVVSEDAAPRDLPSFVEVWQRADYDELQRRYAQIEGTSVIVYQQLCATEKRRRQKRRLMPKAKTKVFIHPELCEGCGDCGKQSNCLSIQPLETELGTKRVIDQHSCNTDLSCIEGSVRALLPCQRQRSMPARTHLRSLPLF